MKRKKRRPHVSAAGSNSEPAAQHCSKQHLLGLPLAGAWHLRRWCVHFFHSLASLFLTCNYTNCNITQQHGVALLRRGRGVWKSLSPVLQCGASHPNMRRPGDRHQGPSRPCSVPVPLLAALALLLLHPVAGGKVRHARAAELAPCRAGPCQLIVACGLPVAQPCAVDELHAGSLGLA